MFLPTIWILLRLLGLNNWYTSYLSQSTSNPTPLYSLPQHSSFKRNNFRSGEWLSTTVPLTRPLLRTYTHFHRLNTYSTTSRVLASSLKCLTDFTIGCHQVWMHTIDTWETTFHINFGLYEWIVMPFGMTNSQTTFMWLINDIFRPHLGIFVLMYLDDILFFLSSWEDHPHHVHTVLENLYTY